MSTPDEWSESPDSGSPDLPFPELAGQSDGKAEPLAQKRQTLDSANPQTDTSPSPAATPERSSHESMPEPASAPTPSAAAPMPVTPAPQPQPVAQPTTAASAATAPATGPTDSTAIAAMICGITGIIFSCVWGLGAILGVIAVVMALNARKRLSRPNTRFRGRGMAMTGLVTGLIAIALGLAVLGIFLLVEFSA